MGSLPREGKFFDLFNQHAGLAAGAAVELQALLADNADAIMKFCGDIARLESEADFVFRSALAKLFREESDAKQILKLREVYPLLESITDKAEDVANVIAK